LPGSTIEPTFVELLQKQRIVAIIREKTAEAAIEVGERFLAAGVHLIEVSLVTPAAIDVIDALSERASMLVNSRIGGGTVLKVSDVESIRKAGGTFVLSPVFDHEVVAAALAAGVAVVPGCATPSEMLDAANHGADVVKIFPASNWTPGSLRDLLQALPDLKLLPTGGVTEDNVADWLESGAIGVGLGSVLKRMDDAGIRNLLDGQSRLNPVNHDDGSGQ